MPSLTKKKIEEVFTGGKAEIDTIRRYLYHDEEQIPVYDDK